MDGFIMLSFQVHSQPGIKEDVSLNETCLEDKLHRKYDNYYLGECKSKDVLSHNFSLQIPIEKKNFLRSDSTLILTFLASDRFKYEIRYTFKMNTGYMLNYVIKYNRL